MGASIITDRQAIIALRLMFGDVSKDVHGCGIRLMTALNMLATDISSTGTNVVAQTVEGPEAGKTMYNPVVAIVGGIPTVTWDMVTFTFTGALLGAPTIIGYQIMWYNDLLAEGMLDFPCTPITGTVLRLIPRLRLPN